MQVQSFYVRTDDKGVATYQLVIPVLNMAEGYSIRVKAEDGSDIPCESDGSGTFTIRREDMPGQFRATISLVDAHGNACDERAVEISVGKGTDPKVMEAVVKALSAHDPKTQTGIPNHLFVEANANARGEDIAAACEQYFRSDMNADWRLKCMGYLRVVARSPNLKNHVAKAMDVIYHAIDANESDEHASMAIQIGTSIRVSPPTRFAFLYHVLQSKLSSPVLIGSILEAILPITPSTERPRVAAIATEFLAQQTDTYHRKIALKVIAEFGYRGALPAIRQVLAVTTDADLLKRLIDVLVNWKDIASAPELLEILDLTNDAAVASWILAALRQLNYREAIPRIETMIPVSAPNKGQALEAGLRVWK